MLTDEQTARLSDPIATALRAEAHAALDAAIDAHVTYARNGGDALLDAAIASDRASEFARYVVPEYIISGKDPTCYDEKPDADEDSVHHAVYVALKAMEAKLKERMAQVRAGMTATVRAAETDHASELCY